MTKTLEDVILTALENTHDLDVSDETYAESIAQAVREWMLSDENVERAARSAQTWAHESMGQLLYDDLIPPTQIRLLKLHRAALEAVIGRTDTQDADCTGSRSVGVGHGRSGDGDPAPAIAAVTIKPGFSDDVLDVLLDLHDAKVVTMTGDFPYSGAVTVERGPSTVQKGE